MAPSRDRSTDPTSTVSSETTAMPTLDLEDGELGELDDPTEEPYSPAGPVQRYLVGQEIGRGGSGLVVEARDQLLRRTVALKVLRAEHVSRATRSAHFVAEARLTARLEHPAIVPVHDLGTTDDGRPFYAMKLVKGRTLHEVLKLPLEARGSWNLRRLLRVLLQVCDGVGYAHARGVVHRDLKPGNIMVGDHGEVWVVDWGVAGLVAGEGNDRIEVGVLPPRTAVGTKGFASPEQLAGEDVDVRTDVYALGAILAVILERSPESPAELRRLAERATDPDPDRRPRSVAEVTAAIEAWQAHQERREADRLGWARRHLELSVSALEARAVRLQDALVHLAELARLWFETPARTGEVDAWIREQGFAVDADGFVQPAGLVEALREKRAPRDALSWYWPPSRRDDPELRGHFWALRQLGRPLRALVDRVPGLTFVYYMDARNGAVVFPADDMAGAVPSEFDFTSYPAFVSVTPALSPDRGPRITAPHVDYGNQGLITSMAVPVWLGDRFVGAWAADVPLATLHADVRVDGGEPDELTVIVDRAGLVIAAPGSAARALGPKGTVHTRRLADEGGLLARLDPEALFAAPSGERRIRGEDGEEVVVLHRVAPALGWAVCTLLRP